MFEGFKRAAAFLTPKKQRLEALFTGSPQLVAILETRSPETWAEIQGKGGALDQTAYICEKFGIPEPSRKSSFGVYFGTITAELDRKLPPLPAEPPTGRRKRTLLSWLR